LLACGASIDIAPSGVTPLHFAAACGKIGVMKVLLEHHADVISKFHAFVFELYMLPCLNANHQHLAYWIAVPRLGLSCGCWYSSPIFLINISSKSYTE
jgi:ankyrin repeat protein